MLSAVLSDVADLKPPGRRRGHADRGLRKYCRHKSTVLLANPPSIATTRSFHLDNRNIDRRNDANTAEFTRTVSCPTGSCEERGC
jgi:hypothetical protein